MRVSRVRWWLALVVASGSAWGYSNADGQAGSGGPHRQLNTLALRKFLSLVGEDPLLKHYDCEPSSAAELGLKLAPGAHLFVATGPTVTTSGDWYKDDLRLPWRGVPLAPTFIEETETTRPFAWWVTEGGYTADEPESYMSLRHFYDPLKLSREVGSQARVTYLTDQLDPYLGAALMGANPQVDAKAWALRESRYSLAAGTEAFDLTCAGRFAGQAPVLYARLWRSLGECMHLLADMTVPAHVRNDAHPGVLSRRWEAVRNVKSDPYEEYVTTAEVTARADYQLDPGLRARLVAARTPDQLFDAVAEWTNAGFFTADTIGGTDRVTRAAVAPFNGQSPYPSPVLADCDYEPAAGGGGYYKQRGLLMARRDPDGRHRVDAAVAGAQANRLIPAALWATVKLLDLTLPRVSVELDDFDWPAMRFRCHMVRYARDERGAWKPLPGAVFPACGDRVIVFSLLAGQKRNYLLPVTVTPSGSFEVRADELVNDVVATARQHPGKTTMLYYAVGVDLGGIFVKSEPFGRSITASLVETPRPPAPEPAPRPLDPAKMRIRVRMNGVRHDAAGLSVLANTNWDSADPSSTVTATLGSGERPTLSLSAVRTVNDPWQHYPVGRFRIVLRDVALDRTATGAAALVLANAGGRRCIAETGATRLHAEQQTPGEYKLGGFPTELVVDDHTWVSVELTWP